MTLTQKIERHAIYRDEIMTEIANEIKSFGNDSDLNPIVELVLKSLRDRLGFENSLCFLNLLPLPFKAMFVKDWSIKDAFPGKLESFSSLINEIMSRYTGPSYTRDSKHYISEVAMATFRVIGQHVSRQDFEKMLGILPLSIRMEIKEKAYPVFYDSPDTSIWLS